MNFSLLLTTKLELSLQQLNNAYSLLKLNNTRKITHVCVVSKHRMDDLTYTYPHQKSRPSAANRLHSIFI